MVWIDSPNNSLIMLGYPCTLHNFCSFNAHTEFINSNQSIIMLINKVGNLVLHVLLDIFNKSYVVNSLLFYSLNTVQVWAQNISRNNIKRLRGCANEDKKEIL